MVFIKYCREAGNNGRLSGQRLVNDTLWRPVWPNAPTT